MTGAEPMDVGDCQWGDCRRTNIPLYRTGDDGWLACRACHDRLTAFLASWPINEPEPDFPDGLRTIGPWRPADGMNGAVAATGAPEAATDAQGPA